METQQVGKVGTSGKRLLVRLITLVGDFSRVLTPACTIYSSQSKSKGGVIAKQTVCDASLLEIRSDRPMVHVPVENIMSKWYGESEKRLSAVFEACDEMGGAIIFIDEADALAGSRSTGGMHEATRRVLSVILQKVLPQPQVVF